MRKELLSGLLAIAAMTPYGAEAQQVYRKGNSYSDDHKQGAPVRIVDNTTQAITVPADLYVVPQPAQPAVRPPPAAIVINIEAPRREPSWGATVGRHTHR